MNTNWAVGFQVVYVMTSQALSGAVRLVVPKEAESRLFSWVAILTGSKNALKGLGFFVGAALLQFFGFRNAPVAG